MEIGRCPTIIISSEGREGGRREGGRGGGRREGGRREEEGREGGRKDELLTFGAAEGSMML